MIEREAIEDKIGVEVNDSVYESAVKMARKKLQSIIERFGDANGERRSPEYLDQLIIEACISELLTEYTTDLALSMGQMYS